MVQWIKDTGLKLLYAVLESSLLLLVAIILFKLLP